MSSPQDSAWKVGFHATVFGNTDERAEWYEVDVPDEFAANAAEGWSPGLEVTVEYRAAEGVSVVVSAGLSRAKLHAEVHRTSLNQFSTPDAVGSFIPLSVGVRFSVFRGESWEIRLGPDVGLGLFRETEVVPEFGRARAFGGELNTLLGGKAEVLHSLSGSPWSLSLSLGHFRTAFRVEELETGELSQELGLNPVTASLGLAYRF